jgi:hypothetical protein
MQIKKEQIAWGSAGRAVVRPVWIIGETAGWSMTMMAWLMVTGIASSVVEGISASRWRSRTAAAVLTCLVALPAFAAAPAMDATYSGGTAQIAADTPGTLDATSPVSLLFRSKAGEVSIPYAKIRSYEPRRDVVHHLGVLPAVAVGLVAARMRSYTTAISYGDDAGGMQVVVVETTERDQRQLQTILHARAASACLVKDFVPGCGAPRPGMPVVKPAARIEPVATPAPAVTLVVDAAPRAMPASVPAAR